MKYHIIQQGKQLLITIAVLLLCGMLLVFSQQARISATEGLYTCGQLVIPSLFVFFCLCQWFTASDGIIRLTQWLKPLFRLLFGSYWKAGSAWFMALLGGYPMGASTLMGLEARGCITAQQVTWLSYFFYIPSPAFVITGVGVGLFGSLKAGLIVWASCTTAALAMTVIGCRVRPAALCDWPVAEAKQSLASDWFTQGVASACRVMLQICGMVVLFRVFSDFLSLLPLPAALCDWLSGLGEITNGCIRLIPYGIPSLATVLGFGGVCTHMQVKSILKGAMPPYGRYCWVRVCQGGISYLFAMVLCHLFPGALTTAYVVTPTIRAEISLLPTVALLITCMVFLYSLSYNKRKKET